MLLFDEAYAGVVGRVLERARSRIQVSQFKIDSFGISGRSAVNQLLVTLVRSAEKGIKVQVLLDCILPLKGRSANNVFVAQWLARRGVEVRSLRRNVCQHSKVVLVDGEHGIVGSHNWTVNSLSRNSECSVYFTDVGVVRDAETVFSRLFSSASSIL